MIWDRIVCGIINDQVRRRLLREGDLTLDKAIDICRVSEITTSQVKTLIEEVEVHKLRIARMREVKSAVKTRKPDVGETIATDVD